MSDTTWENIRLETREGAAWVILDRPAKLNALNRRGEDYEDMIVDGIVGGKTLMALKSFMRVRRRDGRIVLLRCLNGLQLSYYVELVERREKDEKFLFGWVNHRVVI